MSLNNIKKSFTSRTFRAGSLSIIIAAAVIALAVVLNIAVSFLPDKYKSIDVTADGSYSLSDEAVEFIRNIDYDIEITYIVEAGEEQPMVEQLLERAVQENSRIKLSRLDPAVHPEQASAYKCNSNSFVVKSDKREKVVDFNDLTETHYYYDGSEISSSEYQQYYAYYQYGMTQTAPTSSSAFCGQSALASALRYVTTDTLPVVYTLSGHGELALDEKLSGYLETDNITVKDLKLISEGDVPDDAAALLITVPKTDLSESECEAIEEYVRGGGQVVVYTYFEYSGHENFNNMMKKFGLERVDGYVVETESGMHASNYTDILPKVGSCDYTSGITGKYVYAPTSHGIKKTEESPEDITITEILTTSDKSYARPADSKAQTVEKTDGDTDGPFMLSAEAKVTDGGSIVWSSSPYLCMTKADTTGAATELFLAYTEKNCNIDSSVALATKPLTSTSLTVSGVAKGFWSFVLIGALPLGVIIAGLYIWNKRRKR